MVIFNISATSSSFQSLTYDKSEEVSVQDASIGWVDIQSPKNRKYPTSNLEISKWRRTRASQSHLYSRPSFEHPYPTLLHRTLLLAPFLCRTVEPTEETLEEFYVNTMQDDSQIFRKMFFLWFCSVYTKKSFDHNFCHYHYFYLTIIFSLSSL